MSQPPSSAQRYFQSLPAVTALLLAFNLAVHAYVLLLDPPVMRWTLSAARVVYGGEYVSKDAAAAAAAAAAPPRVLLRPFRPFRLSYTYFYYYYYYQLTPRLPGTGESERRRSCTARSCT